MRLNIIEILARSSFALLLLSLNTAIAQDNKTQCVENHKVSSIPRNAKRAIKKFYKVKFSMADGDGKFQSSDVVRGRMLKERRLIFWSLCEGFGYLVYEHGGYGYHKHVVVFTVQDKSYTILRNVGLGKAKTLEDIKEVLKADKDSIEHF